MRTPFFLLAALALAFLGSSCTDADRCAIGSEGCVCDDAGGCDEGLACDMSSRRCGLPQIVCENSCLYAEDGVCDDGGPGSEYNVCNYGTDCIDCEERPNLCTDPALPTYCHQSESCWGASVDCWTVELCPDDTYYACDLGEVVDCSLTGSDRCVPSTVCDDSCPTAGDNACDTTTGPCRLGTDCMDCGPEANPCAFEADYPVYCPATPDVPEWCWSRGTDCDSVQWCSNASTWGACDEGYRYDCDTESCVSSLCTDPTLPVDCGTGTCYPVGTDCTTTLDSCGSVVGFACPFGFTSTCPGTLPSCVPKVM